MKPAINQMIAWLEGEMLKCTSRATFTYMDRDYRLLDQAKTQALKIKERCDADDATLFDVPAERFIAETDTR